MQLFHSPGSCSLGIRILLERLKADYTTVPVPLAQGAQHHPAYRAQNPKGKVPALTRPDGSVLTEYPVIAQWLAQAFPDARLLPEGDLRFRALEVIEFVVASLHMRGSTLATRPEKFSADPAAQDEIRTAGRAMLKDGLPILAATLGEARYFFDLPELGAADATVYYLLQWHGAWGLELPENLAAFYAHMSAHPAVRAARA